MSFNISQDKMYHFPHNTLFVDELILLLKSLDQNKKQYSFKEITGRMFIKELQEEVFSKFHKNKPYRIIVKGEDIDKNSVKKKLLEVKKMNKKPQSMNVELYNKLLKENIDEVVKYFLEKRREDFILFKDNPEKILKVQYKPTKTWGQNWVEFARDYIDFSAYCGLTPCYYKLPMRQEDDGYIITQRLIDFLNGKVSIEDILMDYKYSNSSINVRRYDQFNIRVRPFFSLLKLLWLLEKEEIKEVDSHLLFGSISCITDEKQIEEAKDYIIKFIKSNKKISNFPKKTLREITRFSSGMHRFLTETNLIITSKNKKNYSITEKGKNLIQLTPPNSLFFGQYTDSGIYYSPLIAYLLKIMAESSKSDVNEISINEILNNLKNVEETTLISALKDISSLSPSPINKVNKEVIELNIFSNQYAVSPYVDFSSLEEAEFVSLGGKEQEIKKLKITNIEVPPKELITELITASNSSDGDNYELVVEKALKLLNVGIVKRYGQKSRFKRLSDIVWKLEYESDGDIKTLLVIFETKAGNAISAFREDKESGDMVNTLMIHKDDFKNLQGIWIVILDSNKIPSSNSHGGFRGDGRLQKSFMDKLSVIHQKILASFGKPVLVTAFAIRPFIEYYTYLYSLIRLHKLDKINSFIDEFYMKGKIFFDDYRYIKVINDEEVIKKSLFV